MSSQLEQAAPTGGYLSPDGYWWWDGANWVPAAQRAQAPTPVQPQVVYAPRPPRRPLPWFRILAGSSAVVGTVAALVASIVPYGTFPDPNGGPATTSSIFDGGFSGAGWDIAEPVFAMLAGAVAATIVFIWINRTVQAIAAGVLIAVGVQTATMWVAYIGLAGTDGSPEAGGVIGAAGALLMFAGGLLALAGLPGARVATETAPAAAAAITTPVVAQAPVVEPARVADPSPELTPTEEAAP